MVIYKIVNSFGKIIHLKIIPKVYLLYNQHYI